MLNNLVGIAELAVRSTKKVLPSVLIGSGIIGCIGSAIWGTTRAMKKVPEIKQTFNDAKDVIFDAVDNNEMDEETAKQTLGTLAVRTGGEYVKTFIAPVLICGLSIFSIIKGHGITVKENKMLTAAYAALGSAYTIYRQNVKERFGEDVDSELANGFKREVIEQVTVDKNGKEKITKTEVLTPTDKKASPYSFFWGEDTCARYYTGIPETDKEYLINEESYFNNIIKIRAAKSPLGIGIVTLNEVLKRLELPEQIYGFRAGWVYRKDNPFHNSDNYISFGIFKSVNARFIDGLENKNVLLDFNCDGDVESMYESFIAMQK